MKSPPTSAWVSLPPDAAQLLGAVVQEKVQQEGWKFVCDNEDCTPEMGSVDGMLPLLLLEAAGTVSKWSGKTPPLAFIQERGALLEVVPDLSAPTISLGMWLLHVHYALESWVEAMQPHLAHKDAPIPIDGLFANWMEMRQKGTLSITSRTPQPGRGLGADAFARRGMSPDALGATDMFSTR